MVFGRRIAAWSTAPAALLVLAAACGTDAKGVEACRSIETARCERALGCGIDLSHYTSTSTSESDQVDGCIRFYHDACLHGLVAQYEPALEKVNACVSALATAPCSEILAPETNPSCVWLYPGDSAPPPAVDAATDAATDAAGDASSDAPVDANGVADAIADAPQDG